jgi:hypothetical protein
LLRDRLWDGDGGHADERHEHALKPCHAGAGNSLGTRAGILLDDRRPVSLSHAPGRREQRSGDVPDLSHGPPTLTYSGV